MKSKTLQGVYMANSRKFCANKLSTKVNLQAFRFPAVFRLVVALGNRLKETILILAFQSTLQLQLQLQRKFLKSLSYLFRFLMRLDLQQFQLKKLEIHSPFSISN